MSIRSSSLAICTLLGVAAFYPTAATQAAVVSVATPANITPATVPLADPGLNVLWDVNGDGVNDFNFTFRQPQTSGGVDWQASVFPLNSNRVISTFDSTNEIFNATALTLGTTISGTNTFAGNSLSQNILGENYAGTPGGEFTTGGRYLGFSLTVGNNLYYGWMGLQVARSTGGGTPGVTFVSAAYNNTAGGAVVAGAVPEPGTWALLGVGTVALFAARLRRQQA